VETALRPTGIGEGDNGHTPIVEGDRRGQKMLARQERKNNAETRKVSFKGGTGGFNKIDIKNRNVGQMVWRTRKDLEANVGTITMKNCFFRGSIPNTKLKKGKLS